MHTATIQGVDVPTLGFGTWELEGDDCERGVGHALDVGYRHIDTAQIYGNEDRVGAALASNNVARDDVFLTTKLWIKNFARDKVAPSVEDSLTKLQTDYVDLLLIHWPSERVDPAETLEQMSALVDEGKVRHLGVSNYPPSWVQRAADVATVFCNQVEYHPYLSQDALRDLAVSKDFLLTAYSPLARGNVLDDDTLTEIGNAHDVSPAQVTLAWLMRQDHVAAIPKATSPEHIESNWKAGDVELSDDEMKQIHSLATDERIIDPKFAADWERRAA